MWKQAMLLAATLLAFGVSLTMMSQAVGLTSPWMALMGMLCFLGLAKVADPIFVLKLPESLRPLRPWELSGNLYRRLAVPEFGVLLRDTPLRFLNLGVYVSRRPGNPFGVYRQVESAEASHFWAAVLLLPYLLFCAWSGHWAVLGGFLFLQLVANVYPILHLRTVRGRLDRVRRRLAAGHP